jgi:hypothetical protein
MERTQLPKGRYFIGDPCYIMKRGSEADNLWISFVEHLSDRVKGGEGKINFGPFNGFVHGTYSGDGVYKGICSAHGDKFEFPVDAGLISVLNIDTLNDENLFKNEKELHGEYGVVVDFPHSFTCSYSNGLFTISGWEIDTAPKDEEYEDEEDYYEDDEDEY